MNKIYEAKSAIIVLYESAEFKVLDKKLNGQLGIMCVSNSIDTEDNIDLEMTYPSKVNTRAICVVKTDKDTDNDWRNVGGKYYNKYKEQVDHVYFDDEMPKEVYETNKGDSKYFDNYFQIINKFKKKYPNFIYDLDFENFTNQPEIESKKLMSFCNFVVFCIFIKGCDFSL